MLSSVSSFARLSNDQPSPRMPSRLDPCTCRTVPSTHQSLPSGNEVSVTVNVNNAPLVREQEQLNELLNAILQACYVEEPAAPRQAVPSADTPQAEQAAATEDDDERYSSCEEGVVMGEQKGRVIGGCVEAEGVAVARQVAVSAEAERLPLSVDAAANSRPVAAAEEDEDKYSSCDEAPCKEEKNGGVIGGSGKMGVVALVGQAAVSAETEHMPLSADATANSSPDLGLEVAGVADQQAPPGDTKTMGAAVETQAAETAETKYSPPSVAAAVNTPPDTGVGKTGKAAEAFPRDSLEIDQLTTDALRKEADDAVWKIRQDLGDIVVSRGSTFRRSGG